MGTISPAVINAEPILTNEFGVYILQVKVNRHNITSFTSSYISHD